MRILTSLLLAGAAMAGVAVLAPTMARELESHHLTIRLPGGGMETIEYTGNVAPHVVFHPLMTPIADPLAWPAGFELPSFAAFDRMAAEMDRQMDAMMRQAEIMTRLPQNGALNRAVLENLSPGTSYSIVSQSFGNGVCTQTTQVTQRAGDAKPQVVSYTSGSCGKMPGNPPQTDLKQINYPARAVSSPRTAL